MKLSYLTKYLLLPLAALLPALMTGCGKNSLAEQVASAEIALAADDVASTRTICDNITSKPFESSGIEASELCRLSILYMQLDERTDASDALELAVRCYREAWKQNADSARAFFDHLPVDQDKYAMMLATLSESIDKPGEFSIEDHDTIPADSALDF